MRTALLAVSFGAVAVLCTAADKPAPTNPGLAKAFRGTVVSTYPDGRQAELWLNPDGSYTAEGRRHDRSSGHWKLKDDDRICLRQSQPPTLPFSYCTSVPDGGAGGWSAKAVTGEKIQVRIVAGRDRLNRVAANDKSAGRR
ncbi:MAG TPA: hypothetical protein VL358_11560 [Caulobacteraceae bacterium]|jgi:hypothetical protein|nr:hypothetical protein [Caulobacteraceae bacterium]